MLFRSHWVHRVKTIIHSSNKMDAGSAVLMLEKNCCFLPLKQNLGRLKCDCKDMGTLMAALAKYADSDSTKDPESDDDKAGKGKNNGNGNALSRTRQIKEVTNGRLMVVWSLWLTLMRRVTTNGVRGDHLPGLAGQAPHLSSY